MKKGRMSEHGEKWQKKKTKEKWATQSRNGNEQIWNRRREGKTQRKERSEMLSSLRPGVKSKADLKKKG